MYRVDAPFTLTDGERTVATVWCEVGDIVLSGGHDCNFGSDFVIGRSQPTQEQLHPDTGARQEGGGWTLSIEDGNGSCWAKAFCLDTSL